jgi:hypothetical protein
VETSSLIEQKISWCVEIFTVLINLTENCLFSRMRLSCCWEFRCWSYGVKPSSLAAILSEVLLASQELAFETAWLSGNLAFICLISHPLTWKLYPSILSVKKCQSFCDVAPCSLVQIYPSFRRFCLFLTREPPSGSGPPHSRGFLITNSDAPQSVGLFWASDQLVAETSIW